ncbi:hypothetical protein MKZ17_07885 [Solibacillus sp. FSL R7-0682]|uniref:hypothetical protein n=1 Tax=Solibacillus sp. FSL R7-0682 TaxID=2921690 RepID=UPI0030FAF9E0
MDAVFYWDMTYKEITTSIVGYSKRQEANMRIESVISYHQANLISHLVGMIAGSKQAPKALHEAYPGIFPDLEEKAAQQVKQQPWQVSKARIEAYAAELRKRGEKHGNNA